MAGEIKVSQLHCSLEDLLAIRDGEGSAAARRHLESCPECRSEYELVHQRVAALRALPALSPPRDRWPAVRAALVAARRRRLVGLASLAAAALGGLLVAHFTVPKRGEQAVEQVTLEELISQSQALEEVLRSLDPGGRVLNGRAAAAIAELEDRIAILDAWLGEIRDPSAARQLWEERVRLMDELVKVHATRAAYVGL